MAIYGRSRAWNRLESDTFTMTLKPSNHLFQWNDRIVEGGQTIEVRLGDIVRDLSLIFQEMSKEELLASGIEGLMKKEPCLMDYDKAGYYIKDWSVEANGEKKDV